LSVSGGFRPLSVASLRSIAISVNVLVSDTETIKCRECGIEAHIEGSGSEKSFSFSQEEMAQKCKHSGGAICPNIRKALDRIRFHVALDTGSYNP
jgi:hypothetical protein